MARRVPTPLLAALGLATNTACGPCLKYSVDTAHPCLTMLPEDTGDTGPDETGTTGPCLDYAPPDTSETGDTGPDDTGPDDTSPDDTGPNDTADTADTSKDTGDTATRDTGPSAPPAWAAAVESVLSRNVLPEDVAARLAKNPLWRRR